MDKPSAARLPTIAVHRSPLTQKFGAPRQANLAKIQSAIHFLPPYDTKDAFVGIEQYSHVWIVWRFHQNKTQTRFRPQVRPPRLGGNDKLGVFATRSMYRPSALGLSVAQLASVYFDKNGRGARLDIVGADMVDGTPVVDIKPYLPYCDSLPDAKAPFAAPTPKPVLWQDAAQKSAARLIEQGRLNDQDTAILSELIACDPRPAYRQNASEDGVRFFALYKDAEVVFFGQNGFLVIADVRAAKAASDEPSIFAL